MRSYGIKVMILVTVTKNPTIKDVTKIIHKDILDSNSCIIIEYIIPFYIFWTNFVIKTFILFKKDFSFIDELDNK